MLLSQAVTVRQPHVLYISGWRRGLPPPARYIETARGGCANGDRIPGRIGSKQDWDAVLLDNYPDHELSDDESAAIEKYAFTGGGLIFIAGDKNALLCARTQDAVR